MPPLSVGRLVTIPGRRKVRFKLPVYTAFHSPLPEGVRKKIIGNLGAPLGIRKRTGLQGKGAV